MQEAANGTGRQCDASVGQMHDACMVHSVELMSKYKSRAPPRLSFADYRLSETTRVQGNWTHGQSLAEKQYVGLVPSSRNL
jgi:hypothetical protein